MSKGIIRPGIIPVLFLSVAIVAALALLSGTAQAQSVQILHYNPGDTMSYTGSATAGSTVNVMISTSVAVDSSSGSYSLSLSNLNVPACTVVISAHPISSITFTGAQWVEVAGIGAYVSAPSKTMQPSGTTGSYSYSPSGGKYNIQVSGAAASGATSVTIDVYVSQSQTADGSGRYTESISTAGLPSGVYYLSQNGVVVADIYLGVTPPPTFTYNLHAGWNMISVPLTLSDNSITAFFPANVITLVTDMWYYNSGTWMYFSGTRGYSPKYAHLTSVQPGCGYWVKVSSAVSFTISGQQASSGVPSVGSGWTMIGVNGLSSLNAISAYSLNKNLWYYDNGQWYYYSGTRGFSSKYPQLQTLEPGKGYWVDY